MKVLVAYVSRTGNTKKVAEVIFGEIQAQKDIKELKDVNSLEGYDLTFIGFPIENYGPAKEAKDFLEKHAKSKKVALFITHAAPEDSGEFLKEWLEKCRSAAAGADLVGVFDCQGELAQNIKDAMSKHQDPKIRYWVEMDNSQDQPDATRLERACVFAKDVMTKEMG